MSHTRPLRKALTLLTALLLALPPYHLGAQTATQLTRQSLLELGNSEYEGNDVRLLPSPREKYDALLADLAQAQRYILLEYFWLANDSIGQAVLAVVGERASQGVQVRLLIDGYANHKAASPWPRPLIDSLNAQGIRTALYDPFRFPWLNHTLHRDHRKVAIIDGNILYTGGMNIADYYLTGTPRSGQWRDMHLRIEGPATTACQQALALIWRNTTGEDIDSLLTAPTSPPSGTNTLLTMVNREPRHLSRTMRQAYASAIDAAQTEVRIISPYPTGVRLIRKAMHRALRRGVRVMVVASAKSDVRCTPNLIAIEMRKLAKRGCEVYYYDGGFHHSKLMTVDGELCTVGSANLDGRSMLFDYEVNAFLYDPALTDSLNAIIDSDLRDSELFTADEFRQRFSLGQRMAGRILVPLRGLF